MEQLLELLPKTLQQEESYRSFIYQPERISLNSRQSLKNPALVDGLQFQSDYYNSFMCELKSPLLRVKSIELLRATIPNALTSIPNSETIFYYYRVGSTGAPDYLPDYSQLDVDHIHMVRLLTNYVYSPDNYANPAVLGFNKTFEDYDDLVNELNKSTLIDPNFDDEDWAPNTPYPYGTIVMYEQQRYVTIVPGGSAGTPNFNDDGAWTSILTPFIPGDISFDYNSNLNKIVVQGNFYESEIAPGEFVPKNYYLPVGYADPNLELFIERMRQPVVVDVVNVIGGGGLNSTLFPSYEDYTLNRRLGILWDGVFEANPPEGSLSYAILGNHTFPKPNFEPAPAIWIPLIYYTAESYADLVFTANIFIYCDIVGGSTQDTNAEERLLAVVPTNASNLGVIYGESKVSVPLTKVSQTISQITFSLRTDTAEALYLPKNAYINLELKLTYF